MHGGDQPGSERNRRAARNALIPYLDLFKRLGDGDLSKLTGSPLDVVAEVRAQVDAVQQSLGDRRALLPQLSDAELVKVTGAKLMTIRFWRLTEEAPGAPPPRPEAEHATAAKAKDRGSEDLEIDVEEEAEGQSTPEDRETVSGGPELGASLTNFISALDGRSAPGQPPPPADPSRGRPPAQWASQPAAPPKPPAPAPHGRPEDEIESGFSDLFDGDL